jgi:hypothetical protein
MARGDISTKEVFAAAAVIIEQAKKEGVEWALAGGLALHLQGCPGVTQNAAILGSAKLKRESERKLSFGGESYSALVGEREIAIDFVVRDDVFRDFYVAALRDAQVTTDGWRVVTPEWMAILKFLAGRAEDQLDLLRLLKEPNLVDRDKVEWLLEEVMGKTGAQVALLGLWPFYAQAEILRARDGEG